jgi:hypothetical protein
MDGWSFSLWILPALCQYLLPMSSINDGWSFSECSNPNLFLFLIIKYFNKSYLK